MAEEIKPVIRLILAIHSRELKTALYLALSGEPQVQIVATAVNGAELHTYNRAFLPDAIVLEWELPGLDAMDFLNELSQADIPPSVFIVSKPSSQDQVCNLPVSSGVIIIDNAPEDLINKLEELRDARQQLPSSQQRTE